MRRLHPPRPNWQAVTHIAATVVLSANIFATGLPAMLASYQQELVRTPQPLAASTQQAPLAADAQPAGGKAQAISQASAKQLEQDYQSAKTGKQDRTHIKTLDQGRTAFTKTYINADGSRTEEQSFDATSYKDAGGNWQDVDNTLVQDQSSGAWQNKANDWTASFSDVSDMSGVSLKKGNQTLQFGPIGAGKVKPVVTGTAPNQVVTYRNVWQGIDLRYSVTGSALKEQIIVKSRAAATTYPFALAGSNLAPDTKRGDGWFKLDGQFDGYGIAAPVVATQEVGSEQGSPTVSQTVNNGTLTVRLDPNWVKERATADFPLIIDPTIVNNGVSNAMNYSSSGGAHCAGTTTCENSTGRGTSEWGYWHFQYYTDQSAIFQPNTTLLYANLHLQMQDCSGSWGTCNTTTIYTQKANGDCIGCIDYSAVGTQGDGGQSYDINVTGLYQERKNLNDPTSWFMVWGMENSGYTFKRFKNNLTTISFVYSGPTSATTAIAPADGATVVNTQPTLVANPATSPTGDPVYYSFTVANAGGGGATVTSGWTPNTSWTVPDYVLQDGTSYSWNVTTWNGITGVPTSAPNGWSTFRVDMRNGKGATQVSDSAGPVSTDLATGNLATSNGSHSIAALGDSLGLALNYNSPQRSRPGLVGQYWNDTAHTDTVPNRGADLTRVDPNVDFYWADNAPYGAASGTPYPGIIPTDYFAARWTGYFVAPQAGTYQFGARADDRARLYLNDAGTPYVDIWSPCCQFIYGSNVTLAAGQVYPIKFDFYEDGGGALAQIWVKTTDGSIPAQVVPSGWLQTGARPVAVAHGLTGRYYLDDGSHNFPANPDDPTKLFLTRTDPEVSMNWNNGSPLPNGPQDNFLVRWSGWITVPVEDDYKFGVASDDGARIILDGTTTVVNAWSDHGATPTLYGSTQHLTATAHQITVEYYEHGGSAAMWLKYQRPATSNTAEFDLPSSWMSPQPAGVPEGWSLSVSAAGKLGYDFATINQAGVVLHDSAGSSHEYKASDNGGFTTPTGEAGQLARNADGTFTFQDTDGRTYLFNTDGTIQKSTQAVDDRNPAALRYSYSPSGSSGTLPHLTQITDGVDSSRWAKVWYGGDSGACTAPPSGFVAAPASFICAVTTSDGQRTDFFYANDSAGAPRLARILRPGSDETDYGYEATSGRLTSIRDSLANDAIVGGQRTSGDTTITTNVSYDALGRVSGVTLPAATVGATRLAHTYEYAPSAATTASGVAIYGTTKVHVSGNAEPNGFSRQIAYDASLRTVSDTTNANLTTTNEWDVDAAKRPRKDLLLNSTDPTGLRSTTKYDFADRPTDQYGPAPAAYFSTDTAQLSQYASNTTTYNTPVSTYANQVPHSSSAYDESIQGLAAAYYDVSTTTGSTPTKVLFGAPRSHQTGIGAAGGDVVKTWGASQPITPSQSAYGWGVRLTGYIKLSTTGNYTFQVKSDDGAQLWIDDTQLVNDWSDHGSFITHASNTPNNGVFNNPTANSWHRIRLDYYNKAVGATLDTDAHLELWQTPPGGSATSAIGAALTPSYGLPTSNAVYDATIGNTQTTSNFGANPELGLLQSATADPSGLNYTGTSTYETQGAAGSLNRQASKTLPGGGGSYPAPASTTIIDEGLASGWGDWSWGSTINFNDTTTPYAGTKDTSFTINSAWAGLDVHASAGVSTTPYSTVSFAIKGAVPYPSIGLNLMNASDAPLAAQIDIKSYGSAPDANGYVTYNVPLSVLGGANTTIYGLMFADRSGAAQPTMYVDAVKLTAAPSTRAIASEGLNTGWSSWSWGSSFNFNNTSNTYDGAGNIAWTVSSAWGAMDVHYTSNINTAPYASLNFELKNSNDNVPLIYAGVTNSSDALIGSWVDITHYAGALDAKGYRLYSIPLSALGAANTNINGLTLQDQTGTTQPTRYLDAVTLTTAPSTPPATTTYSYWGATNAVSNPCVQYSAAVSQAGFLHLKAEPDPDGFGPLLGRTIETVYDAQGRVVASRVNTDPWSCTTYDTRGRVSQTVTPTINGRAGRTLTYNYAVSGNPFVGSVTDSVSGTSSVTIDLLGRAVSATDVFGNTSSTTYDTLGRVGQSTSLKGTEVPTYDSYNRVTGYALNGTTYATMTYDQYGRLATVNYPQATNGTNTLRLTSVSRDALQRTTGSTFTFADNTTMTETVTLSAQKGIVTADSITQGGHTAGAAYTYDGIGRLTQATIDNWQYQYTFGTQQAGCSATPGYNANANKNGNRTSTSVTNTLNSQNTTTTSCYNSADQLASSTDTQIGTPTYDDHGNITQLTGNGTPIQFTYDAADQNTKIQQGSNWTEYVKSAGGSVLIKREYRAGVLDKVYRNIGGVMQTCSTSNQNTCTTLDKYIGLPGGVSLTLKGAGATPIYSMKNFHGDTAIQVAATGLPSTSVMLYDPFGQVLASNTFSTSNATLTNASDNGMGWAASLTCKAHERAIV